MRIDLSLVFGATLLGNRPGPEKRDSRKMASAHAYYLNSTPTASVSPLVTFFCRIEVR